MPAKWENEAHSHTATSIRKRDKNTKWKKKNEEHEHIRHDINKMAKEKFCMKMNAPANENRGVNVRTYPRYWCWTTLSFESVLRLISWKILFPDFGELFFLLFVFRSFSKFVFVVHALFCRRRSPACHRARRLLGQPFICYSRDSVWFQFAFVFAWLFHLVRIFALETSTMTTTSICLARIILYLHSVSTSHIALVVSKWVASRFQKA